MKVWILTTSSDVYCDVYVECFTIEAQARAYFDDSGPLDGDRTQIKLSVFDTVTGVTEHQVEKQVGDGCDDEESEEE